MSIYAHLHELNEPYKEVFMLRVFGELEYAQIAKLFGKTESWARVTYHRAKTRLTESVKEVSVEEPAVVQKKEKKPIGESLKLMAKNDQLVYSVLSTFIACVGIIGRYGVLSYYVIYVVGSYTLIAPVFSIMSFAQMVGNMPLPWLTKKFGKVRVYIWANIATAVVLAVLFLLFMTPNNAVIIALSAVVGFLGASGSISYSFTCDAVEYGDWKYGIRDDGLAFSIMSFCILETVIPQNRIHHSSKTPNIYSYWLPSVAYDVARVKDAVPAPLRGFILDSNYTICEIVAKA